MPNQISKSEDPDPQDEDVSDLVVGMSVKQARAFQALARGDSITDAARAAKVTRKTLYDWLEPGKAFSEAYERWKRSLAETCRTRLLQIGEAATRLVAKAIADGDTRCALRVVERMGLLSPPPTGPSLTQTNASIRQAELGVKGMDAKKIQTFQEILKDLSDDESPEFEADTLRMEGERDE